MSIPAAGAAGVVSVDLRDVVPRLVVRAGVGYLVIGGALHLTWLATGRQAWLEAFRLLNGSFLISCAAIGLWQAVLARRFFASTDPLRLVWTLLLCAAGVRLAGHVLTNVLAWPSPQAAHGVAQLGRVVSGPVFMTLVALALAGVVRVYQRRGLLVRLEWIDLALIGGVGLFALRFLYDLAQWRASASVAATAATATAVAATASAASGTTAAAAGTASVMSLTLLDAISWTSDPLLAILLLEAILIRRAAVRMGAGYLSMLLGAILIRRDAAQLGAGDVSRCWSAFAAGIFLTSLGDAGIWAVAHGYAAWPWTSAFWYVWPLADIAFAAAPAWQVVACRSAQRYETLPAGAPVIRPLAVS
jgi:hypothetical protein